MPNPTITSEIARIKKAKDDIVAHVGATGWGLAVESASTLDQVATTLVAVEKKSVAANVKEGETYRIPAGYHDGSGTVSGVGGGGNYNLQSKSVTPTKAQQSIAPDEGYYGLSDVVVTAIPAAYQNVTGVTAAAADVLTGKVIVNSQGTTVAGEMANNGAVSASLTTGTTSYTVPQGYHSGSGKVSIITETKTATPTKSTQDITPSSGKVLSKVTVNPIPTAYQDVSGVTATASTVLVGNKFVNSSGTVVDGSMPNLGDLEVSVDGISTTSFYSGAGYYTSVSLDFDDSVILEQLQSI